MTELDLSDELMKLQRDIKNGGLQGSMSQALAMMALAVWHLGDCIREGLRAVDNGLTNISNSM